MSTMVSPERPLLFGCEGERLLGVLHPAAGSTGVVVIVGGPQYRAGSHRHFVQLARALAAAGHPVLRFDVRGMGDSSGALHAFEEITPDVDAAIEVLLAQQPQVRHVVLWGLCDGASAALLYLHDRPDPRVAGLCLLNPWVRSAQSLARTQVRHYYRQRLTQPGFWRKLLSGRIGARQISDWVASRRVATSARPRSAHAPARHFAEAMGRVWQRPDLPRLLVLSGEDYVAKEFREHVQLADEWVGAMQHKALTRVTLDGANHTFSQAAHCASLEKVIIDWLGVIATSQNRCTTDLALSPGSIQ